MDHAEERAGVVSEALTWLGTPYHHHAALKGVGADCGMFPLAVFQARGLVPQGAHPGEYPADWAVHRGEERYVDFVLQHAREVFPWDAQTGDLAVWRWGRSFSHGGILLGQGDVIHAWVDTQDVTVDRISRHAQLGDAERHPARFFSVWGR